MTHRRRLPALPAALLAALLAAIACFVLVAATPAHARSLPSQATWHKDVRAAEKGFTGYLSNQAQKAPAGAKLAINLDIDNTSLATHYAAGTAVGPTLKAARKAHDLGIAVFFNTGRIESTTGQVRKQLARVGYPVDALCGRTDGEHLKHSKQRCRDSFVAAGYTIIANVGNNDTDFYGKHNGREYVLPNYGGQLG